MMVKTNYSRIMLVVAVMLSFFSCRKTDSKFADPAQKCRIEVMTGLLGEQVIHRKFTYNQLGDPVSVVYVETEDGTGTPSIHFSYNDQHQLIIYTGYAFHKLTY